MFLGRLIYEERCRKGLTQSDLACDICTQNTISKIEKHNLAPTVNILIKLCKKLDLSLNDVFSDFTNDTKTESHGILKQVEQHILAAQFATAIEKFNLIKENNIKPSDRALFNFIRGMIEYGKNDLDGSLFSLDKSLKETKNDVYDIYTLLVYITKGLIYNKKRQQERSKYFFDIVAESLQGKFQISNASPMEGAFILKELSKFYLQIEKYKVSLAYSERGISLNRKNNTVFFLEYFYWYASSAFDKSTSRTTSKNQYTEAALFFSKFFKNEQLEQDITEK